MRTRDGRRIGLSGAIAGQARSVMSAWRLFRGKGLHVQETPAPASNQIQTAAYPAENGQARGVARLALAGPLPVLDELQVEEYRGWLRALCGMLSHGDDSETTSASITMRLDGSPAERDALIELSVRLAEEYCLSCRTAGGPCSLTVQFSRRDRGDI